MAVDRAVDGLLLDLRRGSVRHVFGKYIGQDDGLVRLDENLFARDKCTRSHRRKVRLPFGYAGFHPADLATKRDHPFFFWQAVLIEVCYIFTISKLRLQVHRDILRP